MIVDGIEGTARVLYNGINRRLRNFPPVYRSLGKIHKIRSDFKTVWSDVFVYLAQTRSNRWTVSQSPKRDKTKKECALYGLFRKCR